MKLTPLIWAAGLLPTVAAGPFDFLYYREWKCRGRGFGCREIDAFVCCGSPPGRENFRTVRASSVGPVGVAVFTYDVDHNCGPCQFTGTLGTCYDNTNPFNNGLVLSIPNTCSGWGAMEIAATNGGQKVPVLTQSSNPPDPQCRETAAINFAVVNGLNYTLTSNAVEEVAKDLIELGDEEFGIKWAHLRDD
ncbi:hypothetical protein MY11210_000511 [Beauveria gryllotalpidicola]